MSTPAETTIILCGGAINYSHLPIGTNLSNAMIPINGKPVISWILNDLLAKNISRAVIVIRELDVRLHQLLKSVYVGRMAIEIVTLKHEGTILQSLQAGLHAARADGLVRVILGDTLITDAFDHAENFVYVGSVTHSQRWCLALLDSAHGVIDYINKQEVAGGPHWALAGYYHFLDGAVLRACVDQEVAAGHHELSDALRSYGQVHPLRARPVQEWYDFGHIDNIVEARRKLLQPRYFNQLVINPVLNTITKTSAHEDKLRDELNWYLDLPDDLKVLTPRILSHQQTNGHIQIVQEYYGYPNLAELYVYGELSVDVWLSILRHVLRIHQEFRRYPHPLEKVHVETMYFDKTFERLDALKAQDPAWTAWLERPEIVFNGQPLKNLPLLADAIHDRVRALAESASGTIIHGDFCFSNILFDVVNQIVRLIDPRGSFGPKGIFGDPRYDMAKLRHSVGGAYDFILADMFDLRETASGFEGTVFMNGVPPKVSAALDQMLVEIGYDLNDIRFIESLLFVSMLPLHHTQRRRQQWMYLYGLAQLNEVLDAHCH